MESAGSISTKVYRKDTHTDQYLNFSSNHLLEHKRGVMTTLMNMVDRLVSEETELGREKDHIRKALRVNRYPDWMLADSRMSDQCDPGQEEREDVRKGEDEEKEVEQSVNKKTYPVVLPYMSEGSQSS